MATSTPSTADVRAWAQNNGVKVADRGRISAEVLEAWRAAHPQQVRKITSGRPATPQTKSSRTVARAASASLAIVARADARPADSDYGSSAAKIEERLVALEQRLETLEQRLAEFGSPAASREKGRLFRRG